MQDPLVKLEEAPTLHLQLITLVGPGNLVETVLVGKLFQYNVLGVSDRCSGASGWCGYSPKFCDTVGP